MRRVKLGVIGVGIQGEGHVICIKSLPNAELIAIADVDEKRARYIAERYGIPKVYRSHEELVRDAEIDAVTIATPDFLHKDPVICAAENGKHILVEKPMATTLEDAKAMASAVRKHNVKLMVNFENRFNPAFVSVKETLDRGEIGKPLYAYIRLSDTIYVPTEMIKWSHKTDVASFLMSHTADLARWYFSDEVHSVYAISKREILKSMGIDTPDMYVALIKFKRGGSAVLESSWILPRSMPSIVDFKLELICSKGTITVDTQKQGVQLFGESTWSYPSFIRLYSIHGRIVGFLREALGHFVDCIAQDREPLVTVEDGLADVKILDAIRESAAKGKPIEL